MNPEKHESLKEFDGEWLLLFNEEIVFHCREVEEILKVVDERFPPHSEVREHVKITKAIKGSSHHIF